MRFRGSQIATGVVERDVSSVTQGGLWLNCRSCDRILVTIIRWVLQLKVLTVHGRQSPCREDNNQESRS